LGFVPYKPRNLFDRPILQGGIHQVNFFNGRLLTATDLRDEQAANRQQHRQLGQAAGSGVVYGLEVSMVAAKRVTTNT
jgi:hypothetical protein